METQTLILLMSQVLAAAGVFIGIYALSPKPQEVDEESDFVPLVHRGQMGAKRAELKEKFPLYALSLPLIVSLSKTVSMLPLEELRVELRNRLVQAGNPGAFTPDEFLAIPVFSGIAFPGMWYLALNALEVDAPPALFLGFLIVGLILPMLWLNDAVRRRRQEISRALPYILDMLTLSIEAGLDFISAVERIVTKKSNQGPLSEELYQMLQELKMGKTRRDALRDLARRVNLDSMKSVVANLIQADQLGTPLGPILRIQSDMLRVRRSQEAEKLAMEAPVKLLFPLMLIFMAVMGILLGPLVIRMMNNDIF